MHRVSQIVSARGHGRDSHSNDSHSADDSRVRLHAYKFGDHLRPSAGHSALAVVSNSDNADLDVVKGGVIRALYGDDVALERIDWGAVQLFLIPGGEEITSPSMLCADDKVVVYVGADRFIADITDAEAVLDATRHAGYGLPSNHYTKTGGDELLRDDVTWLEDLIRSAQQSLDAQTSNTSSGKSAGPGAKIGRRFGRGLQGSPHHAPSSGVIPSSIAASGHVAASSGAVRLADGVGTSVAGNSVAPKRFDLNEAVLPGAVLHSQFKAPPAISGVLFAGQPMSAGALLEQPKRGTAEAALVTAMALPPPTVPPALSRQSEGSIGVIESVVGDSGGGTRSVAHEDGTSGSISKSDAEDATGRGRHGVAGPGPHGRSNSVLPRRVATLLPSIHRGGYYSIRDESSNDEEGLQQQQRQQSESSEQHALDVTADDDTLGRVLFDGTDAGGGGGGEDSGTESSPALGVPRRGASRGASRRFRPVTGSVRQKGFADGAAVLRRRRYSAASMPPSLGATASSSASLEGGNSSSSSGAGANLSDSLITSRAEALIQRLEQLEARTRAAGGAGGGSGVPSDPVQPVVQRTEAQRRLSLMGNEKLRRAVHKLVLINRFNKMGWGIATPGSLGKDGMLHSASAAKQGSGYKPKSRWGLRTNSRAKTIGKSMDAYIKEQVNLYQYNEFRKKMIQEDDEKLPWYIIKPDEGWRIGWDMMILVLVFYYTLIVPIRVGFDVSPDTSGLIFDYWSDCVFIVDVALSFMTTYKEDGVYVNDRWKVVTTYATTWLPIDFTASFPVGWFTDNLGSGSSSTSNINKILRMLRLFKLFRLLRLLKLFPKLMALLETSIKIDPAVIRFLRSFLALLMMWHLMGCSYWYMVRTVYNGVAQCPDMPNRPSRICFVNQCLCDIDLTRDTSLVTVLNDTDVTFYDPNYPDTWVPFPGYANQPVINQYWWSIFWAVAATTSVGMNIVPKSSDEIIFSVVMILLGLMMYSVIIGSASSALSNLDIESAERKQTLERIIKYMRGRKVPAFFQKIIKDYYEHSWSLPQADEEVLNDLPETLRSKLNMILNRDLVDRLPVMQFMNIDTYLRVVQRLSYGTFLPGDFIVRQGDVGDHLYFIKSGKVDAVLPNGVTVFMTFRPGEFFGEHSLLYLTRRDASYRAVDFVDLLIMTRADFTELYITAPDFVREVQKVDVDREKKRLLMELEVIRRPKRASRTASSGGDSRTTATTESSNNLARDLEGARDHEGKGSSPTPGSDHSVSYARTSVDLHSGTSMNTTREEEEAAAAASAAGARASSSARTKTSKQAPGFLSSTLHSIGGAFSGASSKLHWNRVRPATDTTRDGNRAVSHELGTDDDARVRRARGALSPTSESGALQQPNSSRSDASTVNASLPLLPTHAARGSKQTSISPLPPPHGTAAVTTTRVQHNGGKSGNKRGEGGGRGSGLHTFLESIVTRTKGTAAAHEAGGVKSSKRAVVGTDGKGKTKAHTSPPAPSSHWNSAGEYVRGGTTSPCEGDALPDDPTLNLAALDYNPAEESGINADGTAKVRHPYQWSPSPGESTNSDVGSDDAGDLEVVLPMQAHEAVSNNNLPDVPRLPRRKKLLAQAAAVATATGVDNSSTASSLPRSSAIRSGLHGALGERDHTQDKTTASSSAYRIVINGAESKSSAPPSAHISNMHGGGRPRFTPLLQPQQQQQQQQQQQHSHSQLLAPPDRSRNLPRIATATRATAVAAAAAAPGAAFLPHPEQQPQQQRSTDDRGWTEAVAAFSPAPVSISALEAHHFTPIAPTAAHAVIAPAAASAVQQQRQTPGGRGESPSLGLDYLLLASQLNGSSDSFSNGSAGSEMMVYANMAPATNK